MALPRIMFVSAVADFKGGAEVVLRNMLRNPYIEPVLAVPEEGPLGDAAAAMGVPVCYYRPTAMLQVHRPLRPGPVLNALADAVRCAFRLRSLARQRGCTILHSNGLKPHMLCALLSSVTRTRVLVHLHDFPYRRSERAIWRTIARQVEQVILVSRPCFPADVLPSNVKVVRNGIEMVLESLPDARPDGALRLGFVGRFHPNKGLDLLLDWFGAIRRAGIDATLTIRGRPDPDMPEYWEAIQARIREEQLGPWIHEEGWTTGRATYANIDVLLMTSKTPDPAPLVVPEAMSAGVIVAGYPAGGIPGMIDDERTGLLVEDGATLVRKLKSLLADPNGIERIRSNAYAAVRRDYSMARFHAELRDCYLAMIA